MVSSSTGRRSEMVATETSPLLQNSNTSKQLVSIHVVEVSNGSLSEANVAGGVAPVVGSHEENDQNTLPSNVDQRQRVMWALPALAIGIFLSAADQIIVVSTYGKIGSELQALSSASWIATAYVFSYLSRILLSSQYWCSYFLTLTSFQPFYGRLSDLFGRKATLLFSFGTFGLGCLFCGLARTMNELIAARAFAGIGGGGMTTVVAILLSDVISLRDRGTWQGYCNIVYAIGGGVGGPLGGVLADYVGWRW